MEAKEQGWYLIFEGMEIVGCIEERSTYVTWDELPNFLLESIKGDVALSVVCKDHESCKKDGMVTFQDRNVYSIDGLNIKTL